MTALSHEDLDKLLALAAKASSLWLGDPQEIDEASYRYVIGAEEAIAKDKTIRDFIAAAKPTVLESLVQEVLSLREAVKPFADAANTIRNDIPDRDEMWEHPAAMEVTAGDFRRAAKAVSPPSIAKEMVE